MLAITVLGSGIAAVDATVVNIALPTIGRDFHTGVAALQWVANGYTLTLAGFLLIGGSLGDRFGRRRVYLIGVVWFALASVACGLAPSAVLLVAARILQGFGAALLTPGSLAILEASFVPDDRARAIGAWSGLGGLAIAAGPVLGGYLITAASWRWIFFINVPIAAAVVVLGARHVPESRDASVTGRLDYGGAVAAAVFLSGLTYAFIEAPTLGWLSPAVLMATLLAIGGLTALLVLERREAAPMLPLSIFRERQFTATNAVTFIVYAALTGATFLLPLVLQVVSGYSPLGSGLALLPLTAIMLTLSARSGRVATRIGPRLQLSIGPVVVGAGVAALAFTTAGSTYVIYTLPAIVILGLGLAITVAPLTATAMSSAPTQHSGIASAINNDVARVGGLLAVAVLPTLAGITGKAYLDPETLAAGFTTAVLISGGLCVAAGLLAAATITNPGPARRPAGAPAPEYRHCGLEAPPLTTGVSQAVTQGPR
ncbi:MFS transporter [Georgenia ruanii]|uniref:MFS transporter n=1 Tax=Georgenia ruanii TaxID=348442 RepID=UPI001D02A2BA|nr:MFS transporter [Georgenia ruanii]